MDSMLELSGATVFDAVVIVLVFFFAMFVGSMVMPGRKLELADGEGSSRTFCFNGLSLLLATVVVVGLGQMMGWLSLTVLHTHFFELFVVTNVLAIVVSGWLYLRAVGTERGKFWRDLCLGRELNPSLMGMDLKLFSYRPSLIALALFNLSFAVVQYETYGELSLAMILYQIFTFVYVLNHFQYEYGMAYTWDIVQERFGLMLVWGDFVLVPFFYCIGGWWLVHAEGTLAPSAAVALVALYLFGFWLFRGANQQKHRFKENANTRIWGRPAEVLGGHFLVSGFWGIGRHLNYTGEICIYLAFILTTGFDSWIPYLLPAWLIILLLHRSRRDEKRCHDKYGALWEQYRRRVRYSMIPYVY